MADLWRNFWIRETGTGQQEAQLHDLYDENNRHNVARCRLLLMTGGKKTLAALECPLTLRPQILCKSAHWLNGVEGASKNKQIMPISEEYSSPFYDGQ